MDIDEALRESVETRVDRLSRNVREIAEKQNAILSYLENEMCIELVRVVGTESLRFAKKKEC